MNWWVSIENVNKFKFKGGKINFLQGQMDFVYDREPKKIEDNRQSV